MINKEIIEKIILENNLTKIQTKSIDMESSLMEELKWSDERITLRDFIAGLSEDDITDLIALMDYGRELYHMKSERARQKDFMERRQSLGQQIKTDKEKSEKASYLLKNAYLSEYLQQVLQLFENNAFNS